MAAKESTSIASRQLLRSFSRRDSLLVMCATFGTMFQEGRIALAYPSLRGCMVICGKTTMMELKESIRRIAGDIKTSAS